MIFDGVWKQYGDLAVTAAPTFSMWEKNTCQIDELFSILYTVQVVLFLPILWDLRGTNMAM